METVEYIVPQELSSQRADKALMELSCGMTRSRVQYLFEEGLVTVQGKKVQKSAHFRPGDRVTVVIPDPVVLEATAQDIDIDVVYEDDDVIVVNKPAGMVVHPAAGNADGTLVNALMHHCKGSLSEINGVVRPGIVHRIDKDTSGLIMAAKNNLSHLSLASQLKCHSITRVYEAIASGKMPESHGTIDAPIGRSRSDRKKMCVSLEHSKNAVTHYRLIKQYSAAAHIECRLETGRTHQIRVHMAYIGHGLVGDKVYGPKRPIIQAKRQMLHARTLGFIHPVSGEYMEFSRQAPDDFKEVLTKLERMV